MVMVMVMVILALYCHYESDHYYIKFQNGDYENENVSRPNMQMGLLIGDPWRGSKTQMAARAKTTRSVWHGMAEKPQDQPPSQFFLKPQGRRLA